MNKRFALIALLLAAVMLLSGCNLIGHDDELDGAQVVATGGDQSGQHRNHQGGMGSLPGLSGQATISSIISSTLA